MTTDQIDRLINRRNKLTNRRDGRLNRPALDEIDAKLREVPDGQDNRVDLLLARPCATLPQRAGYTMRADTVSLAEITRIIFENAEPIEYT